MTQRILQKRLKDYLSAVLILLATSLPTEAAKFEFGFGGYTFNATNPRNNTSASLSGVGSYRIAYRHPFMDVFEFDLGYSLIATDTFGGDLSFGFDIGFNYFPLTTVGDILAKTQMAYVLFQHQWRPFIGVTFNQRNFQSTSAQYAGLGFKAGTEYQWRENLSLVGTLRFISLGGPNQSTADQVDILGGVILQY